MKTTSIQCDRCGSPITGGHSIIEVKAGNLTRLHSDPIDLCSECCERFNEWLKGGHEHGHNGAGAGSVEPSMKTVTRGV